MADVSIIAGVATMLKNNVYVTTLLGGGASSVIPLARIVQGTIGGTHDVKFPCVAIQDAGEVGKSPFFDHRFNLRIYGQALAPNSTDYVPLRRIAQECRDALNRRSLSVTMSYLALFEIRYDNYISADAWDDFAKLPFILVRFCVSGTYLRYDPA